MGERQKSGSHLHHLDPRTKTPPSGGVFGSTAEVPLVGALSKDGIAARLSRLNALREKLLREAVRHPRQSASPPRRIGEIAKTIVKVLAEATEPMHVAEIHHAVERSLDRSVNPRSVKSCLSDGALRSKPRFERTAYGCYRLI
jgi:hypothetical protein